METITWTHDCKFCHFPLKHGKPTILFATDKPMLLGISHFTCGGANLKYGHHIINPPGQLSREQVAFLTQFFPMMYSLPSGLEHNAELRRCLADFLWDYPAIMANPIKCIRDLQEQNNDKPWTYKGDLEADYLHFLAKVQEAAKENPANIDFDFPSKLPKC